MFPINDFTIEIVNKLKFCFHCIVRLCVDMFSTIAVVESEYSPCNLLYIAQDDLRACHGFNFSISQA